MRKTELITSAYANICIDKERFYGHLNIWERSSKYFWSFTSEYFQERKAMDLQLFTETTFSSKKLARQNAEMLGFKILQDKS